MVDLGPTPGRRAPDTPDQFVSRCCTPRYPAWKAARKVDDRPVRVLEDPPLPNVSRAFTRSRNPLSGGPRCPAHLPFFDLGRSNGPF
jgi:hypothetical protein